MSLTPIALENATLLRRLQARDFASKTELAKALGRDVSNLNKTLKILEAEGLVLAITAELTDPGANAVRMLDRLEGSDDAGPSADDAAGEGGYVRLPHAQIIPDPQNPRTHFDDDGIAELAASIAADDLLEPLIVRPSPAAPGQYMLIAGERRWRAIGQAIFAGAWAVDRPVPAIVRDVSDSDARRLALVENLQRRDLKPIEEARALQALQALTGASAAQLGRDLGFTGRWAQQRLQLLELPDALQTRIEIGNLTIEDARHAAQMWDKLPPIKRTEIERGAMTVASAKVWLDQQPQPLSDAARLAIMEFYEKVAAAPYNAGYNSKATRIAGRIERTDRGDNGTAVNVRVDDDPKGALAELRKRYLVDAPGRVFEEQVETGETYLNAGYNGDYTLKQLFPSALDPKFRKANIPTLRVMVYGLQVDFQANASGGYATPWLNTETFKPSAEVAAEIAKNREAREDRERKQREETKRHQEAQAAQAAKRKAEFEASAAVEPELRQAFAVNVGAFSGLLTGKAQELGWTLPLYLDEEGAIFDAAGREFLDSVYHYRREVELPPRRLLVAAINVAAGLETPAAKPVPMDPDALPRAEFLALVVEHLTGMGDHGADDATNLAEEALESILAEDGWIYGEADAYDWNANGALSLAEAIRRDFESEDDDQVDLEDAIAEAAE